MKYTRNLNFYKNFLIKKKTKKKPLESRKEQVGMESYAGEK